MSSRRLAILGFHKVGREPWDAWGTWFYTPEDVFAAQLAYLRQAEWQVIDAATFLRGVREPETLPRRAALITFDDGYKSVREVALPVLVEFGYPAVVFMPSDFVGGTNDFDAGTAPEEPLCGWDDLEELERCGVSVQSHGASHRALSKLDPAEQKSELLRSKATLEDRLGKPVEAIAYPYGDAGTNGTTLEGLLARLGYRAGLLYGGRPVTVPVPRPYRLPRVAIGWDSDLALELDEDELARSDAPTGRTGEKGVGRE